MLFKKQWNILDISYYGNAHSLLLIPLDFVHYVGNQLQSITYSKPQDEGGGINALLLGHFPTPSYYDGSYVLFLKM